MLPFALTIFFGAFLLFQVQPMIGKFILPWFGGGPGVWTTCMLFFQLVLLAGYAYAHGLNRWLAPRAQGVTHLVLLAVALATLPITPSEAWKPQGSGDPRLQILLLLGASVGMPYFVLSATGPLIQRWFTRVRPDTSPYRLYALSNVGSLLALLSYPFFFEIQFSRRTQASLWAMGLVGYTIACAVCAWRVWASEAARGTKSPDDPGMAPQANTVSIFDQALWLLLPACASALLLAVTNKMCQDVAVIPLLWIAPLAIYLLSFILTFDSSRWYRRAPYAIALALALGGACWALHRGALLPMGMQLLAYLGALFTGCMVCHGELHRLRPPAAELTRFYLLIAAGGAIGGLFVGLVAPVLFSDYFELHLALLLCGVLLLAAWAYQPLPGRLGKLSWTGGIAGLLGLVALAVSLWMQAHYAESVVVERTRNFYGVLTLFKEEPSQASAPKRMLMHGNTTHGLQMVHPSLERQPTTYYGRESGVGLAWRLLSNPDRRIGVVGLGIGTLATYARTGDVVRVYEINPEVERLARTRFTYLSNCAGRVEVVLGDGRLSLEREPDQNFDLLVLDAFSSDAIPLHLLTREAFTLYQRHLKTNGIMAVHITNRHLNLEPVVANAAQQLRHTPLLFLHEESPKKWWLLSSAWMLLSRDSELFNSAFIEGASRLAQSDPDKVPLWTDDFTTILPIIH